MARILSHLIFLASIGIASGELIISEFLAINGQGLVDKDGDHSDWIELHNTGSEPVEWTGWHLTDDPDNLTKWRLPKGSLAPDTYTIIHASGKDFASLFHPEIHANFSLQGDGEYLALVKPDGLSIAQEFAPSFPEQRRDVSTGLAPDGTLARFPTPTPGAANGEPSAGIVAPVRFSVTRGIINEPFMLQLHCDTPEATIRFTTSGKAPSLFTAQTYQEPIPIAETTIIRAHAVHDGFISAPLETHTYLFLDDILRQETLSTSVTAHPVYGPLMRSALLEHPSISLVTPEPDISKVTEQETSVEMLFPDGADGFQIDAGVKRVGGHSLNAYPKNNMRLYFRSVYGKEALRFPLFEDHPYTDVAADRFDQLNLRSGSHDSLFYLGAASPPQPPSNGQYLRNRWINDMQFLMGHESLRGRWVHVYINGLYWGHYQLLERNTQDYFASYLGGNEEDYVAVNKGQGIGNSDMSAWSAMQAARHDYEEFLRWVDIENYVDYMLLNYYCGNDWDWNPEQNWAGGGPVEPDRGGMKFIAWDSDIIFRRLNDNNLGKGGPHSLFPTLMRHEEFAMLVADRIQQHFHHDGLLTPDNVAKAYNFRAEQIRLSIIPETARWERGRWTRDNQWQREWDRLNDEFFPNRTAVVLEQFRAKGWSGVTAAPEMHPFGGYVSDDLSVRLSKGLFATGTILYTTDGNDPRMPGGETSPTAQEATAPFTLSESATVKARVRQSGGWSPLTKARFFVNQVAASPSHLTFSKIHYRPAAPSPEEIASGYDSRKDFEFVEIHNLSTDTVNLEDVRFDLGIRFTFQDAAILHLQPGEGVFVVSHEAAFHARYGEGLPVAGEFAGSLSNDGETLRLVNQADEILQELRYDDESPWPTEADGDGHHLHLAIDGKASTSSPDEWRASRMEDSLIASEDITYDQWASVTFDNDGDPQPDNDADNDGFSNFLEYVFQSNPNDPSDQPLFTIVRDSEGRVTLSVPLRAQLRDATVHLQGSSTLHKWQRLSLDEEPLTMDAETTTFSLPAPVAEQHPFLRMEVRHDG